MLKYLHIENIAVVERTDIEFDKGLNILTGETGAGKSIIIDSINAILGHRTSKDIIRSGCDKAVVTAIFCDVGFEANKILEENGVFADENSEYIVTRILSVDNKNSIRINGQPVTATVMRSIGAMLINIHGQHDNQSLLNPASHCSFIDSVADNVSLISEYYSEFKFLNSVRKQLQAADTDEETKLRKKEMLLFQINEISSANLSVGELENLKEKKLLFENSEHLLKFLSGAKIALLGDEDSLGAAALSTEAGKNIYSSSLKQFGQITERLNEIGIELEEIGHSVESYLSSVSFEPAEFDNVCSRIEEIKSVVKKYGGSEETALEYLQNANNELQLIDSNDEIIAKLENELEKSQERLIEKGSRVTKSRVIAAEAFCNKVCDVLKELNMPNVKFSTSITAGKYTKNGCDEVEFMISANRGEDVKPLSKIASGGELSRVMLAIKSVLSVNDPVGVLIFDEIDVGISGNAAVKIATQLKKLSENKQVLCVTHLAQIASAADNHYLIEKSDFDNRTITEVKLLNYDGRLRELSRIISGNVTQRNMASAEEMLKVFR